MQNHFGDKKLHFMHNVAFNTSKITWVRLANFEAVIDIIRFIQNYLKLLCCVNKYKCNLLTKPAENTFCESKLHLMLTLASNI